MNRLQLRPQPSAAPPDFRHDVAQSLLQVNDAADGAHALFAPLHYEQNYAYPLIVWLHGPDDNERQLQRVMPLVSMRNYVAVGPRGTSASVARGAAQRGFCWGNSDNDLLAAEQRVFDCVKLAREKYNIHRRRVFLAGYQCGGTMAFRLGLRHPDRFAAVLSLGGPFPAGHLPLLHLNDARQTPLFIAQGRTSSVYPVEAVCGHLRLFHAAGMSVTLRQYPCGDDLTTQMLSDMDAWIMEQVTGVPTSNVEDVAFRPGETN